MPTTTTWNTHSLVLYLHSYYNNTHSLDDELKPISATYTDSLAQLGNAPVDPNSQYKGVALTLIDALDTLIIAGQYKEFSTAVT